MSAAETLASLGEAGVLQRIFPRLPAAAAQLIGPGDDAAVLAAPDRRVVITTDMMIHGPDFRLAWSSARDVGWKAAASNLADVAAMGAVPTALVVALAAASDTPVAFLEEFADGLRAGCEAMAPGCGVVGGDLSVSSTLTIAVTAFGDLEGREPVLRSGARVGDVVAVSGALGAAAEGLRLLFEYGRVNGEPDASAAARVTSQHPAAIAAQLRPHPPIADGRAAAIAGATAMLDLSDGLAIDARRLALASGVAVDLDPAAIAPGAGRGSGVSAAGGDSGSGSGPASGSAAGDDVDSRAGSVRGAPHSARTALDGGEDHSLLATFPPGTALPGGFRAIGWVRAGAGVLVGGRAYERAGGWDPFEGWDGGRG